MTTSTPRAEGPGVHAALMAELNRWKGAEPGRAPNGLLLAWLVTARVRAMGRRGLGRSLVNALATIQGRHRGHNPFLDAFLDGLERARDNGHDLSKLTSVASFFVSRVDVEVDKRLDAMGGGEAAALRGKAAIANARLAYQLYEQRLAGPRWEALGASGARTQRPLWASTGVKDPSYEDTRYVVELVAPDTVNTAPEKTIDAVADHGVIRGDTVHGTYAESQQVFDDLAALGMDLTDVFDTLEREGVQKFDTSWAQLIATVQSELDKAHQAAKV